MKNLLKEQGDKLGRQHVTKRTQEILIKQIFKGDFRFLFYKGQHMVLLYKFDKCSFLFLNPCVHMGWCEPCMSLHSAYHRN